MKNGNKPYQTVLLCRLSREDEASGESGSISSQKAMLLSYAGKSVDSHPYDWSPLTVRAILGNEEFLI